MFSKRSINDVFINNKVILRYLCSMVFLNSNFSTYCRVSKTPLSALSSENMLRVLQAPDPVLSSIDFSAVDTPSVNNGSEKFHHIRYSRINGLMCWLVDWFGV